MTQDTPLLRSHEVMQHFKITKSTLLRWIKAGHLKSVKIGGLSFFHKADIDKIAAGKDIADKAVKK